MKMTFKTLLAVAALGAFTATSCSEKKAEDAANATENTVDAATEKTGDAIDSAKADLAREPGDTAVVRNTPAEGVVEEVPATQK
jgi:hypothetical protein